MSESLAARSDRELVALIEGGGDHGGSLNVEVDDVPVFVKLIPLTDLELAHPRSTANLFDLPMFCHYFFGVPNITRYGFGGPALNGWRELAANLIVTDGVLTGETEAFPVLHHWRVLPVRLELPARPADVAALVAALEDSPAVRARLEGLRTAAHSLVLFSEQLPFPVTDWLNDDPAGKAEAFERQLSEIVRFLGDRRLLHLDGQLGNLRTDGDRIYCTDFGLATSPRFDLSAAEHEFVQSIATLDADYAAMRLVHWLAGAVCGVAEPGPVDPVAGDRPNWQARAEFVRRCAEGDVPDDLPAPAVGILGRHAATAWRTFSFYRRLFDGNLHTPYPRPQPVG